MKCFLVIFLSVIFSFLNSCTKEEKQWAYCTHDISFGFEIEKSDSIIIPSIIYDKFRNILDSICKNPELPDELRTNNMDYIKKNYLMIPFNSSLSIFTMHFDGQALGAGNSFVFVAYDFKTKQCSRDPYFIDANYFSDNEAGFAPAYRMMTPPYFKYEKGRKIFVVKERHHNGNIYNTVEEHWVKIDDDMELIPLFSIETLAFIPFDETKNKISRKLDDNFQLHVTLVDSTSNIISDIGNATLLENGNNIYEWKNIQIVDTLLGQFIFSCGVWSGR